MPPTAGKNWFVRINDSGFVQIAAQRGGSITLEVDGIDITSKDNAAWSDILPGVKSWSLEVDGLIIESEQAQQKMLDAFFADTKVEVEVLRPGGDVFRGMAFVTSLPHEFGFEDAATFSATFTGAGAPSREFAAP